VTEVYHFLRLLFAKTERNFVPIAIARRKTKRRRDRETGGSSGQARRAQGPRATGQGPQRFSHRCRALGRAPGFDTLYVDGKLIPVSHFRKLERFKEHTIDVVVGAIDAKRILKARNLTQRALEIGRGTAHLLDRRTGSQS
jgi:excinuclease ABC subunit A